MAQLLCTLEAFFVISSGGELQLGELHAGSNVSNELHCRWGHEDHHLTAG